MMVMVEQRGKEQNFGYSRLKKPSLKTNEKNEAFIYWRVKWHFGMKYE